jgi:branched-chain amino acid aminotransferase
LLYICQPMTTLVYNGQLIEEGALHLTPANRAFSYGDGFFETIRLVHGLPVWVDDHIDRMNRSFSFLHLTPPFPTDSNHLKQLIQTAAVANGITHGGRIRITFFRESEGFYTPQNDHCSYLIQCQPLRDNHYTLNKQGIHLALYNQNLKPAVPLSSLKTLNSLLYVLAGIYARNQHCHDALIMNDYQHIVEATASNLFVVKNNTILTPGLDEGCVAGVMRRNILKIIENHTDYPLRRDNVKPQDILEADEIFLTNTIRGVQWVVGYGKKRYYNNISAHLISLLNKQISH